MKLQLQMSSLGIVQDLQNHTHTHARTHTISFSNDMHIHNTQINFNYTAIDLQKLLLESKSLPVESRFLFAK